jgi:sodium pump decarboxylase gamma subunit
MTLLAVTADTWIVTGLGFGIVLALLFCLVFILMFFGWTMQKATAPRKPKAEKPEAPKASVQSAEPTDEGTKAAIAMAISEAHRDDIAAVAYALYLAQNKKHDIPTAMISLHRHETAWNEKSIGMNNVGF